MMYFLMIVTARLWAMPARRHRILIDRRTSIRNECACGLFGNLTQPREPPCYRLLINNHTMEWHVWERKSISGPR